MKLRWYALLGTSWRWPSDAGVLLDSPLLPSLDPTARCGWVPATRLRL